MLQEGGGGEEFIELEEVNERLGGSVQQSYDGIPEIESLRESVQHESVQQGYDGIPETENASMSFKLPMSTPLTEESTQNVLPQVISNPIFDESNETHVFAEDIAPRYPQRSNKGVPKKQYEPDPKAKIKYPISNHVSFHRLSKSRAFTISQLSTVYIPSSVQDALMDLNWTKAMNEEMEALQKMPLGNLFLCPKERRQLDVDGYSQ